MAIGDSDSTIARFGAELFGVMAGGAFAAAGVNQVARLWLGRYWTRHTAPIVSGYTQQAVTAIADAAVACVGVARVTAPDPPAHPDLSGRVSRAEWPSDSDIRLVVRLPQTKETRSLVKSYETTWHALWRDPRTGPAAVARLARGLREHSGEIDRQITRCEAALGNLARYRDTHAIDLEQAAVGLREDADSVLRYAESGDPDFTLAVAELMALFGALFAVCEQLTDIYDEVARATDRHASYFVYPETAFTATEQARRERSLAEWRRTHG